MLRTLETSVWDPLCQGRSKASVSFPGGMCAHEGRTHVSEHFVNFWNIWLSQVTGTGNGTRTGTGTGIGTGSWIGTGSGSGEAEAETWSLETAGHTPGIPEAVSSTL